MHKANRIVMRERYKKGGKCIDMSNREEGKQVWRECNSKCIESSEVCNGICLFNMCKKNGKCIDP